MNTDEFQEMLKRISSSIPTIDTDSLSSLKYAAESIRESFKPLLSAQEELLRTQDRLREAVSGIYTISDQLHSIVSQNRANLQAAIEITQRLSSNELIHNLSLDDDSDIPEKAIELIQDISTNELLMEHNSLLKEQNELLNQAIIEIKKPDPTYKKVIDIIAILIAILSLIYQIASDQINKTEQTNIQIYNSYNYRITNIINEISDELVQQDEIQDEEG